MEGGERGKMTSDVEQDAASPRRTKVLAATQVILAALFTLWGLWAADLLNNGVDTIIVALVGLLMAMAFIYIGTEGVAASLNASQVDNNRVLFYIVGFLLVFFCSWFIGVLGSHRSLQLRNDLHYRYFCALIFPCLIAIRLALDNTPNKR